MNRYSAPRRRNALPPAGQAIQGSPALLASRLALAAAVFIILGAGLARGQLPAPLQGASGVVYTADEHGNSISMIDLAAGQVRTVPISISPHNVQVTADGTRLLVVGDPATVAGAHGHGAASHSGKVEGRLVVFDPNRLASEPLASIAVGDHPAHVVVDREGRYALVTLAGANAVAMVDLSRNLVVRQIDTGRYPHGLRISPDGREAYVANVEGGSISVIDIASASESIRIPVGRAPVQVGFTPDGSRVYVSLRDENSVAVIDTKSRAVIARIDVGRNPIQVHATPNGRFVYVANQGTEAEPADTVSVIDVTAGAVVDTIRTGAGAHGVAVSDDGLFVFITNIVAGTVTVIEAKSRSVVAGFAVGKGPNGVTFRGARPRVQ